MAYSFRERLNRAQWRDVIERCQVQGSTLAVRALAAASGGSAGRCAPIAVQLHHRYSLESFVIAYFAVL